MCWKHHGIRNAIKSHDTPNCILTNSLMNLWVLSNLPKLNICPAIWHWPIYRFLRLPGKIHFRNSKLILLSNDYFLGIIYFNLFSSRNNTYLYIWAFSNLLYVFIKKVGKNWYHFESNLPCKHKYHLEKVHDIYSVKIGGKPIKDLWKNKSLYN